MTSRMQMQKILIPVLLCIFFVFMYPTFWIIINVSNVNKIVANVIHLHFMMSQNRGRCYRLCLCMLCVFEVQTILLLLSHRRPSSVDVASQSEQDLCMRQKQNKYFSAPASVVRNDQMGVPRHNNGHCDHWSDLWKENMEHQLTREHRKISGKRAQSWHFERPAMMNLPLLIAIVWFRWERHNLTVETRIKCISTFVSCGLSNFQITCWTAQTEGIQRRRGGWKSVALLYYIC